MHVTSVVFMYSVAKSPAVVTDSTSEAFMHVIISAVLSSFYLIVTCF